MKKRGKRLLIAGGIVAYLKAITPLPAIRGNRHNLPDGAFVPAAALPKRQLFF
jgi:hypothetical protein